MIRRSVIVKHLATYSIPHSQMDISIIDAVIMQKLNSCVLLNDLMLKGKTDGIPHKIINTE